MLEQLITGGVTSTNIIHTSTTPKGLDVLGSIQLLLIQDYDDQLTSIKNQMKGCVAIKKEYRAEIELLHNVLSRKTEKKGSDKLESIELTPDEYKRLNTDFSYTFDLETNEIKPEESLLEKPLAVTGQTESIVEEAKITYVGKQVMKTAAKKEVTGIWVSRDALEARLNAYQNKLDGTNEQSELTSLSLQSITNQRKIAFETLSNLVSKENETLTTIIRNLRS